MKHFKIVVLAGLLSTLVACGGSSSSANINGRYLGTFRNPDNSVAGGVNAQLTQASGGRVALSNFSLSLSSCFANSTTQTATFTRTADMNGLEVGTLTMTVFSTPVPGLGSNVLTVNSARGNEGNFSGSWTLTGASGCNGGGQFTLNGIPPV
jgi:hypothetical protein